MTFLSHTLSRALVDITVHAVPAGLPSNPDRTIDLGYDKGRKLYHKITTETEKNRTPSAPVQCCADPWDWPVLRPNGAA